MKSKIISLIPKESNLCKIKGNFTSISFSSKIYQIKSIFLFSEPNSKYGFILIQCKKINLIGVILLRQSSDLLVGIAKRVLKSIDRTFKILQYRFPNDHNSLKLIVVKPILDDDIEIFEKLKKTMAKIEEEFNQKIDDFMNLLFSKKN